MNILIFDTETIGKVSQDLLNVGYKIIDLNIQQGTYETLVERDYITTKLINNEIYCINDDFVGANKFNKMKLAIEEKKAIKRSIPQMFKTMANDIKKHNVLFGYAYNCNFDIDKFEKTSILYNIDNPIKNLPIFDIWAYAHEFICKTQEYQEWARQNGIFTESQMYIQQSVEGVCKYLYKDLDFIEDHTALSDVQHETNILVECVRRGCDITRTLPRAKNIASEKIFEKELVLPNGETMKIEYKKEFSRGEKVFYK